MALYGFYKAGFDLFTESSRDVWVTDDGSMTSNEQFIINSGFIKLYAYKLKAANYEFPLNAIFALQPDSTETYQYVADPTKYIEADFVTNATYFDEVQYLSSYLN